MDMYKDEELSWDEKLILIIQTKVEENIREIVRKEFESQIKKLQKEVIRNIKCNLSEKGTYTKEELLKIVKEEVEKSSYGYN